MAADSPSSPFFQMRLIVDAPSEDAEPMVLIHKSKDGARKSEEPIYVQKRVLLDQTAVRSAALTTNTPEGSPRIEIRFTDKGKIGFAELTRKLTGRRLAIIIGGQVYDAPRIGGEIPGGIVELEGRFSEHGQFTEQEARDLAARITESLETK